MPRLAAEQHRAHRDVQRGGLLGGEPEIGKEVLVGRDAVALLAAREHLDDERHAHRAQRLLVALERPPVRDGLLGIARDLTHELVARERPAGVEQAREQVQHPLDAVGSRTHGVSRAARVPAAAADWNRIGSAAAGRPIDVTSSPCADISARMSGGSMATMS